MAAPAINSQSMGSRHKALLEPILQMLEALPPDGAISIKYLRAKQPGKLTFMTVHVIMGNLVSNGTVTTSMREGVTHYALRVGAVPVKELELLSKKHKMEREWICRGVTRLLQGTRGDRTASQTLQYRQQPGDVTLPELRALAAKVASMLDKPPVRKTLPKTSNKDAIPDNGIDPVSLQQAQRERLCRRRV